MIEGGRGAGGRLGGGPKNAGSRMVVEEMKVGGFEICFAGSLPIY